MRRIVHLSDVHFGTEAASVVEQVVAKVTELSPDVVVVSGDLTQRARAANSRRQGPFSTACPGRRSWCRAIMTCRFTTSLPDCSGRSKSSKIHRSRPDADIL